MKPKSDLRIVDVKHELGRDIAMNLYCMKCGAFVGNMQKGRAHFDTKHRTDYKYYCLKCHHGFNNSPATHEQNHGHSPVEGKNWIRFSELKEILTRMKEL
jgi:DNA-directed RNA polymerase subunit RPC12/RpoP